MPDAQRSPGAVPVLPGQTAEFTDSECERRL